MRKTYSFDVKFGNRKDFKSFYIVAPDFFTAVAKLKKVLPRGGRVTSVWQLNKESIPEIVK